MLKSFTRHIICMQHRESMSWAICTDTRCFQGSTVFCKHVETIFDWVVKLDECTVHTGTASHTTWACWGRCIHFSSLFQGLDCHRFSKRPLWLFRWEPTLHFTIGKYSGKTNVQVGQRYQPPQHLFFPDTVFTIFGFSWPLSVTAGHSTQSFIRLKAEIHILIKSPSFMDAVRPSNRSWGFHTSGQRCLTLTDASSVQCHWSVELDGCAE